MQHSISPEYEPDSSSKINQTVRLVTTSIRWHFCSADIDPLKSAAEHYLRAVSPTQRLEILARWCGFSTYAAMQSALREAKGDEITFGLNPTASKRFAGDRAIPLIEETMHLILASAASAKVARETPELYVLGYGLFNLRPRGVELRDLLDGIPKEGHFRAIQAAHERNIEDARATVQGIRNGNGFLRALALASIIQPIKSRNQKRNSYGLKHIAENLSYRLEDGTILSKEYVSNGEMIAAAIYAGFNLFHGGRGPNVDFNMSEKSMKQILAARKDLQWL